ncbi:MAG: alanine racemase [Chthoniobacteraceae bacterium]
MPNRSHAITHRTWVEIHPEALLHNLRELRAAVGREIGVIAVVKANAYGHGIAIVAKTLAPHVDMLAVANVAEACEVHALEPAVPTLILSPALPAERAEIVAQGFIPLVSNAEEAVAYSALARIVPAPIHLKLDTGMGRAGVWHEDAAAMLREIKSLRGVEITALASHLPVADEDDAFTSAQLAVIHRCASRLREAGLTGVPLHVANTAGAIGFGEQAGDFLRLGLGLYGSSSRPEFQTRLQPALTWKTRVALIRDLPAGCGISYGRTFLTPRPMRVAVLAVGYADGYRRHLSGQNAHVLIEGKRCPVLGRVTMDQIVVDIGAVPGIAVGAEVVLLGRQGEEEITAGDLAFRAGTIAWDIFTGIGPRVQRMVS